MDPVTRKLEKKMKILDTAFSLFRDYSVSATAIDDIVKAAGIARGTFYLYFKDKSDLLEQIIIYKSTEYMKTVLKRMRFDADIGEPDFYDIIREFLNCFIDFLIENREILPVMNKNLSSCIKNLPDIFDEDIKKVYARFITLMGDFGYSPDKAHMTVYIVIDMVGSVCSDAILHEKPYPIEKIRDTVVDSAICIFKNNADSRYLEGEAGNKKTLSA